MLKLKLQYFGHLIWKTHWKRLWCWERLRAIGEGDDREWDGWIALPTHWAWVWANSGRYWRTGKPGLLQSMGLQEFRHDLVTEQQYCFYIHILLNWLWSNIYFHSFTQIASLNLSLMSQINEFNNLLFNLYFYWCF